MNARSRPSKLLAVAARHRPATMVIGLIVSVVRRLAPEIPLRSQRLPRRSLSRPCHVANLVQRLRLSDHNPRRAELKSP
jgi:hypothetical protein